MLPIEVTYFLRKFEKTVFVYPWEYFTKRVYEETARSIIDNSPLHYIEIPFNAVEKYFQGEEERLAFWKAFFEYLSTQKRICDVCGFLYNDVGIAMMLLDVSANDESFDTGYNRMCDYICEKTSSDLRKWLEATSVLYPPKEFLLNKNERWR